MLLWFFWLYSFLGYLLELGYKIVNRRRQQVYKGFLLLPMCPVYGLGASAILALPPELTANFWGLALWGGLAATAVEYGVHLFYDKLLGVQFWNYSQIRWNLRGRICLSFSLAWGLLTAAVFPTIQNLLTPVLEAVPPILTYAVLLIFTADAVISFQLLRRTGDPAVLSLRGLQQRA